MSKDIIIEKLKKEGIDIDNPLIKIKEDSEYFYVFEYKNADTKGCLLPGTIYSEDAVWNSKEAFDKIMEKVSNDGTIIITNEVE